MDADDPRSDAVLVRACARGDAGALEVLYRRYRDWITGLARRFTGDDAAALDVLQETFAYLLRKGPALRLDGRLTTFLYPVVRNLSLAQRRSRRLAPDPAMGAVAEAAAGPTEWGVTGAGVGALTRAVEALPEAQREVLLMRFAHDMQLDEIALALGVPLGTVKSRLHLAIDALRENPGLHSYFR